MKSSYVNLNENLSFSILCEKCKDPIKEVIDELILYGYLLYHKQCWIQECEDYAKLSLAPMEHA